MALLYGGGLPNSAISEDGNVTEASLKYASTSAHAADRVTGRCCQNGQRCRLAPTQAAKGAGAGRHHGAGRRTAWPGDDGCAVVRRSELPRVFRTGNLWL